MRMKDLPEIARRAGRDDAAQRMESIFEHKINSNFNPGGNARHSLLTILEQAPLTFYRTVCCGDPEVYWAQVCLDIGKQETAI